jgi:hypothetical protein
MKRLAGPVVSPVDLLGVSEWSAFAHHSFLAVEFDGMAEVDDDIRTGAARAGPGPNKVRLRFLQDRSIYGYR